jgi:flagellar basal-body rod modification protein FlgD
MTISNIHSAATAAPTTPAVPTGITTNPAYVAPSAASSSSTGTSASGGVSLGGTDFLTLMLAQLKNQDPTSPVDSNVFLTQLAELSTVQGITQLNTSFGTLSSSLTSNQAMQASSMLGRTALVASSTATLTAAGGTISGAVAVPQNSATVNVNILNSAGVAVAQVNLGAQATGIANFSWNGVESNGAPAPAGQYSLTATVAGVPAGTPVDTYVSGTVQSVTMGSGTTGMSLNVTGLGSVPFASVEQISN